MKNNRIKVLRLVLFFCYLGGVIHLMFVSEAMGRTEISECLRYNLVPFREMKRCIRYWEILGPISAGVNLFGNVAVFMPFGFLLPMFRDSLQKWYRTTALSLLFSLSIETLQLLTRRGSFDVDDLILNTLGGLAGYWCFLIFRAVMARHRQKRM